MKSLINIQLLKEQLKRFWAIAAILMIIYVVAGLIPVYSVHSEHPEYYHILGRNMANLLNMVNPVVMVTMLLSPILAVMALYPYYFSNSASTVFHSFPLNKRQLFWTNIAAAFILMLLPLLIFCLTILMPVQYPGMLAHENWDGSIHLRQLVVLSPSIFPGGLEVGATINSIPAVAGFFARMTLGIMFYFSVFLLAASIAGNRIIAILLSGAFPLIPLAVHGLIIMVAQTFVFGFDRGSEVFRLELTLAYSNPALFGTISSGRMSGPPNMQSIWPFILTYVFGSVVFFVIAYISTRKRKLERTEDSVVFVPFKNICVFLVSTAGMFLMAAFLFGISNSFIGLYAGSVIGFIIAYFVGQMIAEKALDVRHKIKGLLSFGGIMLGLYVFVLLFTHFGMGFYVNRVPLASEVARASIHHDARWGVAQGFEQMLTDDPVAIALTLEAHQQILNHRSYLQSVRRQAQSGGWGSTQTIPITYLLNDGSMIRRNYTVSLDFRRNVMGELTSNPSMILARYMMFDHPVEIITEFYIRFWFANEDGGRSRPDVEVTLTDQREIASLLNEIKEDYIANHILWATEDHRQQYNGFSVWLSVLEEYAAEDDLWHGRWGIGSQGDNPRVLAWLERYGYLDE